MQTTYIYGYHAVLSILKCAPHKVAKLYLQDSRSNNKPSTKFTVSQEVECQNRSNVICNNESKAAVELAKTSNVAVEFIAKDALERLLASDDAISKSMDMVVHQGIVAVIYDQASSYQEDDLEDLLAQAKTPLLLLVLDGVQDPHNLGACLRVANAAKVDVVIIPKDNAVGITAIVRKVACGAAELTPCITVVNLARTLGRLKELGVWLYGAAGEATDSIYQVNFTGNTALVLGAEGRGLRQLTRKHCDFLVRIPMLGEVPSLNVSVAAGICLFEVVRQREGVKT